MTEARSRRPPTAARSRLQLRLPATPSSIAQMRRAASRFAAEHGAPEELAFDIALVVSEAATNAVKYAYDAGADGTVVLRGTVDDGFLVLIIRDRGVGFGSGSTDGLGLGLSIIARLSAEMTVVQAGEGTEVRMRFPLPRD